MELFLYLIFLDLDKIDVYRDKPVSAEFHELGASLVVLLMVRLILLEE